MRRQMLISCCILAAFLCSCIPKNEQTLYDNDCSSTVVLSDDGTQLGKTTTIGQDVFDPMTDVLVNDIGDTPTDSITAVSVPISCTVNGHSIKDTDTLLELQLLMLGAAEDCERNGAVWAFDPTDNCVVYFGDMHDDADVFWIKMKYSTQPDKTYIFDLSYLPGTGIYLPNLQTGKGVYPLTVNTKTQLEKAVFARDLWILGVIMGTGIVTLLALCIYLRTRKQHEKKTALPLRIVWMTVLGICLVTILYRMLTISCMEKEKEYWLVGACCIVSVAAALLTARDRTKARRIFLGITTAVFALALISIQCAKLIRYGLFYVQNNYQKLALLLMAVLPLAALLLAILLSNPKITPRSEQTHEP